MRKPSKKTALRVLEEAKQDVRQAKLDLRAKRGILAAIEEMYELDFKEKANDAMPQL